MIVRLLAVLIVNSSYLYSQSTSRDGVDSLINVYNHQIDIRERSLLLKSALYQTEDDRVESLMRLVLTNSVTEDCYYSAMYLAKRGDSTALAILNKSFWNWPVSSWQMSFTARLFGERKYYRSTDNLIEALEAVSVNLSGEALTALETLYPGAPKFEAPSTAQKYFKKASSGQKSK